MITLKLSDDEAAALGVANAEDIKARLNVEPADKQIADLKLKMKEDIAAKDTKISELEKQLEKQPAQSTLDAEAIKKQLIDDVRQEASQTIAAAIAKTGKTLLNNSPADNPTDSTADKTKIAADDYAGQWAALTADQQAEFFDDVKVYEAYCKARDNGRVKISSERR